MINQRYKHTFVICSYKKGKYLEKCILSLINQKEKSRIIIATSTPNDYISDLAKKYNIEVFVNKESLGIQKDWEYAINSANSDFVTICHHDDIYKENYYLEVKKYFDKKSVLYIHTGYFDIDDNDREYIARNNRIKRLLLFTSKLKLFQSTRFGKMFYLRFGSTITCPSITYNTNLLKKPLFDSKLKYNVDWDFFYKCAKQKGRVIYNSKRLISKRISTEQETSKDISNGLRYNEDVIMFRKFWPNFVTKIILKFYVKAYKIYK